MTGKRITAPVLGADRKVEDVVEGRIQACVAHFPVPCRLVVGFWKKAETLVGSKIVQVWGQRNETRLYRPSRRTEGPPWESPGFGLGILIPSVRFCSTNLGDCLGRDQSMRC